MKFAFVGAADLHDRGQRHRVNLLAHSEQQRLNDSQRERDFEIKSCARANVSFNMNRAFEPLDYGLDHIHAHAATGNSGHFFGGAEPGMKDQIQSLLLA